MLGPDRDFASQLVPDIRDMVEKQLAGAAGWRIVTVDAVGAEVAELIGQQPRPVPTVTTTVDRGVQAAAEVRLRSRSSEMTTPTAQPVPGEVAGGLRSMMRQVVTQGTGRALAGQGELHGKTGTAEYSGGAHGWFVGFRSDLAFATLVVDAGSSGPALEVSDRFLSAMDPT